MANVDLIGPFGKISVNESDADFFKAAGFSEPEKKPQRKSRSRKTGSKSADGDK